VAAKVTLRQILSFDGKAMERFARRRRVRYNNGFGTIVIVTTTSRRDPHMHERIFARPLAKEIS